MNNIEDMTDIYHRTDTVVLRNIYREVLELKKEMKKLTAVVPVMPVMHNDSPDLIKVTKDPDCVTTFIVEIYGENTTKATTMTRGELSDLVLESSLSILRYLEEFYSGPPFLDEIYTSNVRKIVKIENVEHKLFITSDNGKSYIMLKPLKYDDFKKKHIDIYYF